MGFRRSLALIVVATVAPILAFSAVAVYQYGREQSAAAEQALLDAARALRLALDNHFETTITALRVLGTSQYLDAGDLAAFHAQCLRALEARAEWRTISLFDAVGRRLFITSEPYGVPLPGPPPAMTEPFRRVVESRTAAVSDLFQSPLTKHHAVSVGVPIARDGAVRWVISAGMKLDALGTLASNLRGPSDWTAALFDRQYRMAGGSGTPQSIGAPGPAGFVEAARAVSEGTPSAETAEGAQAITAFSRSAFGRCRAARRATRCSHPGSRRTSSSR